MERKTSYVSSLAFVEPAWKQIPEISIKKLARSWLQPFSIMVQRYNDTQHNDIEHNDTKHKELIYDTQHNDTKH